MGALINLQRAYVPNNPVLNKIVRWFDAVSNFIDNAPPDFLNRSISDSSLGANIDNNSLVTGDVSQWEWDGQPLNIYIYPNNGANGVFTDATIVNANGLAGIPGQTKSIFSMPFGATSGVFMVPARTITGTSSIKLVIYASNGVTVLTSARFNINTIMTDCLLPFSGLTPIGNYYAAIQTNDLGQAAIPLLGHVSVTPTDGSGVFASSFQRIRVTPSLFAGTTEQANWNGNYLYPNIDSQADATILTDASEVATEVFTNTGGAPGLLGYLYNGRAWKESNSFPADKQAIELVTLPNTSGIIAPFTVRNGLRINGGTQPQGTFLKAIYVPSACNLQSSPIPSGKKLIVVGDSIANGLSATIPMFQGWVSRIKQRYPGPVVLDAYISRSFFTNANTTALQKAFAQYLAQSIPTDVWMALGVNDYTQAPWNAANFGIAYAAFLDFLHTSCPNTRVFCQSPISKVGEGANAQGSTLQDYRDQIQTAATDVTRTTWCYFVSGTSLLFPTTADLTDGLHPNTAGHGKYGQAVLYFLTQNNIL